MKTHMLNRIVCCALALCLAALCGACGEDGALSENRGKEDIVREITLQYGTYGSDADKTVERQLSELEGKDPVLGAKWRSIIRLWRKSNEELVLHYDVLPDGLPDTDELGIVVLGFQLNTDGTMRDELVERLKVGKASAEKYPNAYVVCTGGHTASANREATEAGVMAEWLTENGIDPRRLIVENQSLTTAQNALYSIDILEKQYPQITKLAIVSSDYHIATGQLLFGAESTLRAEAAGREKYEVISNAAYKAPSGALSTSFQASALRELSGER